MIPSYILPDLLISLIEASLLTYLFSRLLHFKKSYFIYILPVLDFIAINFTNAYISNQMLSSVILCTFEVFLALWCTSDSLAHRFIFGCMPFLLSTLSEKLILLLAKLLFDYSIETAITQISLSRYMLSSIYLLLLAFLSILLVWIQNNYFTKDHRKHIHFPFPILLIFCIAIFVSILACSQFIECILSLELYAANLPNDTFQLLQMIGLEFIIIIFFLFILLFYVAHMHQKNATLLEQRRQLQLEQQQYDLLIESNQILRTWKHDNQNLLRTLQQLISNGEKEKSKKFLADILKDTDTSLSIHYTGITILDTVLSQKRFIIQKQNIQFQQELFLNENFSVGLDNVQLCALLSNILDNAIEACKYVSEQPFIFLSMKTHKANIVLYVKNSSDGVYLYDSTSTSTMLKLRSRKQENGHGIGLERIQQLVQQANGICKITPGQHTFEITILLPMEDENDY